MLKLDIRTIRIIAIALISLSLAWKIQAQNLELVGSCNISHRYFTAKAVFVLNDYAYLAGGELPLAIIDVSDPSSPQCIYVCDSLSYWNEDVVANHKYAYVSGHGGLSIYDVRNPSIPILLSYIEVGTYVHNLSLADNLVYLAACSQGLKILDVHNPRQPVLVGEYLRTRSDSEGLFFRQQYVFLGEGIHSTGELQIFDAQIPSSPVPISYYFPQWQDIGFWDVFVQGDFAYIGGWGGNLRIINISDLQHPTLAFSGTYGGRRGDIYIRDNYLYFAHNILSVFDITNAVQPIQIAYYPETLGSDVFVDNGLIYFCSDTTLYILRLIWTNIEDNTCTKFVDLTESGLFPNPFNFSTVIKYNLQTASDVTLDIYDILGRKVERLLAVKQNAGPQQVIWNADGHPSGVYFARLQARDKSQSLKMVLMK